MCMPLANRNALFWLINAFYVSGTLTPFYFFLSVSRRAYTSIFGKPPRINPPQRIRRILIKIQPTRQPNRVLHREASHLRVVIPEQIIVQPRFAVGVLSGVAQRLMIQDSVLQQP